MKKFNFPIIKPYAWGKELSNVAKVLASGWLTQGPYADRLEKKINAYIGSRFSFLVNSATSGLIAGLEALGLQSGDEVIVPSFTFPATANSVVIAGGRPVFCDIDLATFNIDADKIEALITGKTKGIIAVHAFGLAADMAAVRKIAGKHRLFIIEDAACSFGAEYQGRKTGLFSDVGVFSFHPRKIITCGEGGCVVTNNRETAKKIACLRNHGEYDKKFINRGYNFRLSDIQAAVLDAQMERVDAIIERRIKLSRNYQALLKPWEKRGILKAPLCPRGYRHIYQSYVVLLADYVDRDKVKMFLKGKSIETQFGTYCVPALDYYLKNFPAPKEAYADAYYAFAHSLALPLYHTLSAGDQEYIIGRLNQAINMVAR